MDLTTPLLEYLQKQCYNNPDSCDLGLNVNGSLLKYHRLIVSQSPFIEALCSDRWHSSTKEPNSAVNKQEPSSSNNNETIPCYDIELPEGTSIQGFKSVIAALYGIDLLESATIEQLHDASQIASYLSVDTLSGMCQERIKKAIVPVNLEYLCKLFLSSREVVNAEEIQWLVMHLLCRQGVAAEDYTLSHLALKSEFMDAIWRSDTLTVDNEFERCVSLAKLRKRFEQDKLLEHVNVANALLRDTVYYEHVSPDELFRLVHAFEEHGLDEMALRMKLGYSSAAMLKYHVSRLNSNTNSSMGLTLERPDSDKQLEPLFRFDEKIYSKFAPFRFSYTFNKFNLSPHARVYSDLYFYAGSMWQVYMVQESETSHIAIYLMRARQVVHPSAAYSFSIIGKPTQCEYGEVVSEKHIYKRRDWQLTRGLEQDYPGASGYPFTGYDKKMLGGEFVTSQGHIVQGQPQFPVNVTHTMTKKDIGRPEGSQTPRVGPLVYTAPNALEASPPISKSFLESTDIYEDLRKLVKIHFKIVVTSETGVHDWIDSQTFSVDQSYGIHLPQNFTESGSCFRCNVSILLS